MIKLNISKLVTAFRKSKNATQIIKQQVSQPPLTVVKPSLPGRTVMERTFGDKLVVTESYLLSNGTKKTTTAVFANRGEYRGVCDDGGMISSRVKHIEIKQGESVFGDDVIKIKKEYKDNMDYYSSYKKDVVKEYTIDGKPEHIEESLQYPRWSEPQKIVFDRTKSPFSDETLYSETVKNKQAMELAEKVKNEKELALREAAEKAEQEAKARLRPRVNTCKVFNKNLEDFTLFSEVTKADGTLVRTYRAKGANGKSQYIVLKDKGSFHEEYIVNPDKDLKIRYQQIAEGKVDISMQSGYCYRGRFKCDAANHEYKKTYDYNDGLNQASWDSFDGNLWGRPHKEVTQDAEYAQKFRKKYYSGEISLKDHEFVVDYNNSYSSMIKKVHKDRRLDLEDLFKPYENS